MPAADDLIKLLLPDFGREIHVGPWLAISQERIDNFAEATGDVQWIHTNPERAAKESPYGATIAHGFLTLSLLPLLTESNHPDFFQKNYPGMRMRINYGLNRVRFPAPVIVNSQIRARSLLQNAKKVGEAVEITYLVTIEIEGNDKPACIAEHIVRVYT